MKNGKASNSMPEVPLNAVRLTWVRVAHHNPDHVAARWPYAAFGSNLNLAQMARRCPQAEIMGAGILRSARLVFARYLGIVQDDSATVPIGVYRLTGNDIAALDRYEGHHRGHYDRFLVTVEMDGQAVRCFTYVKRDNGPREPSNEYYSTCLQGYADWSFDSRRLRHARAHAVKHQKPLPPSKAGKGFVFEDWYKATFVARTADDDSEPVNDTGRPHVSLVTGRMLPGNAERKSYSDMRPDEIRAALNRQGNGAKPIGAQVEWTDDTGTTWRKGANGGAWYRVKGE